MPATRCQFRHRRLFEFCEVAVAGEHRIAHAIELDGQHRRLGAFGRLQKAVA
ncbi:hypothetical protein [Paraburkholderia caffeinilytica]|uniref:hypothetical protein n=1 Tax=Paraburkholderia caffeinilytica TaxID=1761016 RepID=UPI003DA0B60E